MTVGAEIKNVLSLDVSKFETALLRATDNLGVLESKLKSAGKGADGFEKSVSGLGSDVANAVEKFKLLDQTISGLTERLNQVGSSGFGKISSGARSAKKDVADFNSEAGKSGQTLLSMSQWAKQYGAAMESIKPSIGAAIASQAELRKANAETASSAQKSTAEQIRAKIAALENERESNALTIAEKQRLAKELSVIEARIRNEAMGPKMQASDIEHRLGAFGGKNKIAEQMVEAGRLDNNADFIQRQTAATLRQADALGLLNDRRARSITLLGEALGREEQHQQVLQREAQALINASVAEDKRERALVGINKIIGQAVADTNALTTATIKSGEAELQNAMATAKAEGAIRAKTRANAEAALGKNALLNTINKARAENAGLVDQSLFGENHLNSSMSSILADGKAKLDGVRLVEEEQKKNDAARRQSDKDHINQIAQMWKGMAQMWAGSKIEKGLGASVDSADKFQREQMVATGLNLPKDQTDYINQKAWDDSKALKFASALDMIKARMAAIGGLGENNVRVIDDLLGHASKVAHNIQAITGDKSSAGFENMIRNLFGVIEARQQTGDTEAAKRTLDMVQKIYIGTGRKIDIADIETFLRRDSTGADKITDIGLAKIVAFLDQAKVSGGHGGGQSGAGVSTVGTMVKMFQKMANGGLMTERGAIQFAEAGLMDLSTMDGKSGKGAMKALREGGLNVAGLSNSDPVAALEKISTAALSFMTRPENLKKYFPGGDAKDPNAIKDAFMKFAIGTGWSTNAVSMLTTAGNSAAMDRAHASAGTIMNSKGGDAMNDDVMKSYAGNMDAFKASMENLKISLGTSVLPLLTTFFETAAVGFAKLGEFFKNNPMATEFMVVATAIGGAVLAFKGFLSMFGVVGSLTSVLRDLIGATSGVGSAAEGAAKAGTGLERAFGAGGLAASKWNVNLGETVSKLGDMGAKVVESGGKFTQSVAGMASGMLGAGAKMISMAGKIAVGMLQIVPVIGQLAGLFLLADWLANLEVGGATLGAWAVSFADSFLTTFQQLGVAIADIFTLDFASIRGDMAALDADLKKRQIANGTRAPDKPQVTEHQSVADQEAGYERDAAAQAKKDAQAKSAADQKAKSAAALKKAQDAAAGIGAGAGDKSKRGFEDLFNKAFQDIAARAKGLKLKISTIGSDEGNYDDQAKEMTTGKLLSGQFDKAHDPKNRSFIKKDYRFDSENGVYQNKAGKTVDSSEAIDFESKYLNGKRVKAGDKNYDQAKSLDDLTAEEAKNLKLADSAKALTFAKERLAATDEDAKAAALRLADGTNKESDAMRALKNEFAREDARNPQSKAGVGSADRLTALANRAQADVDNFTADLRQQSKDLAAGLLADSAGRFIEDNVRTAAEQQKILDAAERAFQTHLTQAAGNHAKIEEMEKAHNANMAVLAQKKAEAMMTPLEKLAGEWGKVRTSIEASEAQWAGNFITTLESALDTGTLDFRGFLVGMLKDIRHTMLQEALANPLKKGLSNLGNMAIDMIKPSSASAGNNPSAYAAGGSNVFSDLISKASSGLKSFWNSITGAGGATDGLKDSLGNAASKGLSEVAGMTTKMTAEQSATASLLALANAASAASVSMGGSASSGLAGLLGGGAGGGFTAGSAGFGNASAISTDSFSMVAANGGVTTEFGPASLKRYAKGGVVNSPQISLFGEAGPEAYVPLPDGRSIPVTMKGGATDRGGAAGNVTISITVNSNGGEQKSASGDSNSDPSQWTRLADRIKGVVREEVMTQSRPGGMLYK